MARRVKSIPLVSALILYSSFVSTVHAGLSVDLTTASGRGLDSKIQSDAEADTNFGSDAQIRFRTGGTPVRNVYLRFDLATLSFQPSEITSASLSIFTQQADSVLPNNIVGLYGIADGASGDGATNFTEANLTWNNAPLRITNGNNDSPLDTFQIPAANNTPDSGRYNFLADEEFTFGPSSALTDFLRADTNGLVTFVIQYQTDDVGSSFSVASKESLQTAPTLSLRALPEVGTFLPLGMSLFVLVLVARPRRKLAFVRS